MRRCRVAVPDTFALPGRVHDPVAVKIRDRIGGRELRKQEPEIASIDDVVEIDARRAGQT